jgi:membrane fusion protein, multidrug efflux system
MDLGASTRGMLAGLLVLSGIAAAGCGGVEAAQAADRPPEQAVSVHLARISHGPLAQRVHASGTLHQKSEADLSFKVGGVVTRVAADVGNRVKRGQVLATVDQTEARAADAQAREALGKATRDLERVQHLLGQGAVGQVEAQNAATALEVARAAAEAADFNLRHTSIVAPDDGVIDRRAIEVGEIVGAGRPVFHMGCNARGLIVRAELADRQVLQIRRGDVARVMLDAKPTAALSAHVTQIAGDASPGTGTFAVELRLDTPPFGLPSGLTAKIEIDTHEQPVTSVPIGALVDGSGDAANVFVVVGERAKRVPVRVGFLTEDRAALASGLEQLDRVVDLGASQLTDGALVQIAD